MATKTFKEICVEYAHQLGKGLPLTPAEMCNAVIMYLNQQVDVMNQFVQTALNAVFDIQQDISEYPAPENIVSTNQNQNINSIKTFNGVQEFNNGINSNNGKISSVNICASDTGTYDGVNRVEIKPDGFISRISPAGTKNILLPDKDGQLATVNDIPNVPEIPNPTTSDNGKVIGVQSGAYALVEQSGGEAPNNMVTTDTAQTITGKKTYLLDDDIIAQFADDTGNLVDIGRASITFNSDVSVGSGGITKGGLYINYPDKQGTLALISDIPSTDNFVTTNTEQTITATKTFSDIKVGSYELTSDGFEYSGANLVRYSASGKEIRYGLSGYNSTVIGRNVKLNLDFNTSYINCTSNNIILGNSNTAIDIRGTRLTYNGADIGSSSGGKLYNHYISCTVTGIGITSPLKIYFNFISTSGTVLTDMYDLAEAIKNQFLSCKGNLTYSVGGDSAIPIYITSDGSNISMGYITQDTNNIGEETLTALETFHFLDRVNEI